MDSDIVRRRTMGNALIVFAIFDAIILLLIS